MHLITAIALLCITGAASVTDIRDGKIPNRLINAGMLLAIVARAAEQRFPTRQDLTGFLLMMIFLVVYQVHLIGGGDVKLIIFLTFLLPFNRVVVHLWISMLFAGAAGIIGVILYRQRAVRLGPAMFLASLTVLKLYGGWH